MSIALAREIVRQGEARLTAAVSLATAADLRATTLCGIFGASAIGIGAAALAYLSSNHPSGGLLLGGAAAAALLFGAAFVAAWAGSPADFWVGGGSPDLLREWSWNNGAWRDELEMLEATAQRYASNLLKNDGAAQVRSRLLIGSLWTALASPALAAAIVLADHFGAFSVIPS
jgi:hypothetical protein